MRIYVSSLGCKLNQSEMDALAVRLAQNGHQVVATPAEADLCVLSTCTVTHVAAQKSRQALRISRTRCVAVCRDNFTGFNASLFRRGTLI